MSRSPHFHFLFLKCRMTNHSANPLSGLAKGEQLLAIAQQRTTSLIWAVSSYNALYMVDPYGNQAYYQRNITCNVLFSNRTLHISFRPNSDELHISTILSSPINHFTVNVTTGQCITTNLLTYAPGNHQSVTPAGAAFNINSPNQYFVINSLPNNELVTVDLATGLMTTVGPL